MIWNIRKVNNIHYASIRNLDISNGEGIGVALFVQGCHFHCYNCFNPNTWDFNGGKEWTQEVKEKFLELIDRPYIKRVSILGGEPLADENLDDVLDLVTEINKRYNFQKVDSVNHCKIGVSEDENADEIRLSLPNKSIWLYSGYDYQKVMRQLPNLATKENYNMYKRQQIIKQCTVMVDGRYIDSQRNPSKKFAGSDNQRIIEIRKSLEQNKIVLHCD